MILFVGASPDIILQGIYRTMYAT